MCDAIAALAHVLQVTTMPKVDLCVFFPLVCWKTCISRYCRNDLWVSRGRCFLLYPRAETSVLGRHDFFVATPKEHQPSQGILGSFTLNEMGIFASLFVLYLCLAWRWLVGVLLLFAPFCVAEALFSQHNSQVLNF